MLKLWQVMGNQVFFNLTIYNVWNNNNIAIISRLFVIYILHFLKKIGILLLYLCRTITANLCCNTLLSRNHSRATINMGMRCNIFFNSGPAIVGLSKQYSTDFVFVGTRGLSGLKKYMSFFICLFLCLCDNSF